MKICLTGPSCAGKTTLARRLKEISGVPTLDLDLIFLDVDGGKCRDGVCFKTDEKIKNEVKKFLDDNDSWIIEGVFAMEEVFQEADLIVMLKPSIIVPLYRQWKRFFTDEFQRKTFGWKTNLFFLTPDIFKQYFSNRGCNKKDDFTVYGVKKTQKMAKKFSSKFLMIGNIQMGMAKDILNLANNEK